VQVVYLIPAREFGFLCAACAGLPKRDARVGRTPQAAVKLLLQRHVAHVHSVVEHDPAPATPRVKRR
jgi:hypothetical protein